MNRKMRLLGMVTLLFFMAGCSGYRTLGKPGDEFGLGDYQYLKPGDVVNLVPRSGPKIRGTVMEVDPESLTVMVANPYALGEEESGLGKVGKFNFSDLETVEVYQPVNAGQTVAVVLVLGVVVGSIALYAATEPFRNGMFSNKSHNEGPVLSKTHRKTSEN